MAENELPISRLMRRPMWLVVCAVSAGAVLALAGVLVQSPSAATGQSEPILGAALTILADGTAPWEDRPLAVSGIGTIPGRRGIADPGDDLGPDDRVVRSWDVIAYRASLSIRDAPADDLVAEVRLNGPVWWDDGQLAALRLSGCPGGATLFDNGQRLRCVVGHVAVPPAVTIALDLTARVSGEALQGDVIRASATVRARQAVPDPDVANCPVPQPNGCDATAPDVQVSAAPAAELQKFLLGVSSRVVDGVVGRLLSWRLDAVLGADGDVRGTSSPVGAPWTLPDWWEATGRNGRHLSLPVRLLGCTPLSPGTQWRCEQPGVGQSVSVTIEKLDTLISLPGGVTSPLPQVVGSVQLDLWVPETDVLATGWDVTFRNCFATQVGASSRAVWAPSDARGQPNLGGLAEPTANNCSHVVLPVPRTNPVPRRPVRPGRPGRPSPGRPPRVTVTPVAQVSKSYTPYSQGDGVTDGSEFAAEVSIRLVGAGEMPRVIACDKWDNSTHVLRDDEVAGVRIWWQDAENEPQPLDPEAVIVEYGKGRWGRERASGVTIGRAWFVQATSTCADDVVGRPGWVRASDVDFSNGGRGKLNAREVNAVRARFTDPLPAGVEVWMEVLFRAEQNPPGTWLMNYAAASLGTGSRTWRAYECYGATGASTRRECPVPAPGTRMQPGPLGDMLVHVGVPLWLTKSNDPPVAGGSPVVNAGERAGFRLDVRTFPRPADPPPPVFPPGAFAPRVVLTDTLPAGLYYELGSATIASEDINGNGELDPGEDRNGNGRIDYDVPFEPRIRLDSTSGETVLVWHLGDLPYERRVPAIRYQARSSRLIRGGTALVNWAGISAVNDRPPQCWNTGGLVKAPGALEPGGGDLGSGRCAWAQVVIANIAAAQVEKVALLPQVMPGEPLMYRLALANLTQRPVEWFDAVDLLPRAGEPRQPETQLTGGIQDVRVSVLPGGPPIEVWASATDPEVLDTFNGGLRDGIVDPATAWGEVGVGLRGPEWPCRLEDVGTKRCSAIPSRSAITALRFWGPDPDPRRAGGLNESFLPPDRPPRYIDVTLLAPDSRPGDLAHNAWGGRFESLPLPVFDAALITIQSPHIATPSPTNTPIPPTETPTPTASPVPSLTPTRTALPTATATRRPRPIYLPMALRLLCEPKPLDVALVIDLSSSMLRDAGDGGSKLDAVSRATRAFLERLAPRESGSRVAMVGFNDRAWVEQPLTGDIVVLEAAVARLRHRIREGTRIDLGLAKGGELLSTLPPERWAALVLLTDGMPNWVPTPMGGGTQEDTVLEVATRVRAQGVAVFTVAYGRPDAEDLADRISPELMKAIAGNPANYYQTDNAAILADLFRRVANDLGCPGDARWP